MNSQPAFHGPLAVTFSDARAVAELLLDADAALPVAPASDRSVWAITSGSADAATVGDLLDRANADLSSSWPQPLASAASRVHRDGDRDKWEQTVFARQRRVSRAAIAAAVTLDDSWIDEVADGLWQLCEQSSWCWPAHDDTRLSHGAVLATVTDPFLDLGAGEVVGQLAWIDQLLGIQLDERYPGLRARLRHEARVRILDPFVRRRDWHWIGLDGDVHNWNPWIHGNVLLAALRFMDAPEQAEERAHVVSLVIEGIDRYVASLPDDGAIDEGYSYWWNGACRALEALDILRHATGGALDAAASVPALRNTVAFPHRMHLGGDWYLNLADGQARPTRDQPWHALHRAARQIGDDQAMAHAASYREPGKPVASEEAGLGRLLRGMTDTDWLAAGPSMPPLPRDVWLESTEVMVAREREGSSDGLTLAAKGGTNGEHHNHNDVGSFVVASDGVPVIVDAGRPTYTAATFGPDRYSIWTMQSSWHNVPEIDGTAQGAGVEFAASDVHYESTQEAASLSLDIARAYPLPYLTSWRRNVALDRVASRVSIDDSWSIDAPAAGVHSVVHLLIAGDVRLSETSAHVTPRGGARAVVITWTAGAAVSITERELDDPMLSEVWGERLTRLELSALSLPSLSVTVELEISTSKDVR